MYLFSSSFWRKKSHWKAKKIPHRKAVKMDEGSVEVICFYVFTHVKSNTNCHLQISSYIQICRSNHRLKLNLRCFEQRFRTQKCVFNLFNLNEIRNKLLLLIAWMENDRFIESFDKTTTYSTRPCRWYVLVWFSCQGNRKLNLSWLYMVGIRKLWSRDTIVLKW